MLWTAPREIATLEVERNTRPVVSACFTTEQSTVKTFLFVIRMFRSVTEFARMFHGPGFINGP